MLAVFSRTTARDRRWWSHCRSLASLKCQRVSLQDSSRRGSGLAIHTSGFDCNWLKVVIVEKVIVFPVSSELSDLCEISDLLLFFSYFASQNKDIMSGNSFFDVCCVN